ncbi:MAG: SDR family oxidoreductase, partial [Deltaproteobacteria bacterium]|nr:SDR family oxidoreductase [Deltaproteobacteria bacterium]
TGQRCVAISADLSLDKEIKRLHDTVTTELGHIDILVNNAGIGYFVALTDLTYNQFNEVLKLNTWTAVYLSQLCHSGMKQKRKGVIINIASTGGIKPDIFAGAYSASKSALIMFTKQIAWEVHGFQNLVNRAGEPDEIAGMALMLASEAGSYCQGAIYLMDGGSTVSSPWG